MKRDLLGKKRLQTTKRFWRSREVVFLTRPYRGTSQKCENICFCEPLGMTYRVTSRRNAWLWLELDGFFFFLHVFKGKFVVQTSLKCRLMAKCFSSKWGIMRQDWLGAMANEPLITNEKYPFTIGLPSIDFLYQLVPQLRVLGGGRVCWSHLQRSLGHKKTEAQLFFQKWCPSELQWPRF